MTIPPNLKHPGRVDRKSRQEARVEGKRAKKADINPQILSLRLQLAALQNQLNNYSQNATQYPGPAAPTCWMNNASGGTLGEGDVVVVDQVAARSVTTTITASDPRPAAVVVSTGPVAVGEDVEVRFLGMADANADADAAAIAKGDPLTTHTTAKYLRRAESQTGNIVAVATEALAAGQDRIAVFMLPSFKCEGFVLETLTADNAGQVTLTHAPYSDSDGPHVSIYDMENYLISFASEYADPGRWGNVSPDRACLSAVGAVVANSKSDFSTTADKLTAFYLRADCYTPEAWAMFGTFIKTEMIQGAIAEAGYFDVKFEKLRTVEQTWMDAINELANNIGVRIRKEIHRDADDKITSAYFYWSQSATAICRHYRFNWSGDYMLTAVYSQLSTDGTYKHTVSNALTYSGGLLDKVIQAVS